MDSLKNEMNYLKVRITSEEKNQAKALAKSKGMTFSGWLGQLVKRELKSSSKEASYGNDAT